MRCVAGPSGFLPAFPLILVPVLTYSCGRNCVEPCGHAEPDLPSWNGSFQRDGQPTSDGWVFANPALASLVKDARPCGGQWCLRLEADWIPTLGFATASVPDVKDGDVGVGPGFAVGMDGRKSSGHSLTRRG